MDAEVVLKKLLTVPPSELKIVQRRRSCTNPAKPARPPQAKSPSPARASSRIGAIRKRLRTSSCIASIKSCGLKAACALSIGISEKTASNRIRSAPERRRRQLQLVGKGIDEQDGTVRVLGVAGQVPARRAEERFSRELQRLVVEQAAVDAPEVVGVVVGRGQS